MVASTGRLGRKSYGRLQEPLLWVRGIPFTSCCVFALHRNSPRVGSSFQVSCPNSESSGNSSIGLSGCPVPRGSQLELMVKVGGLRQPGVGEAENPLFSVSFAMKDFPTYTPRDSPKGEQWLSLDDSIICDFNLCTFYLSILSNILQ